jgi:hypothetical protein
MSETRPDKIQIVTDLWRSILPVVVPSPFQLRIWLGSHDLATVCIAIRECAVKYQRLEGRMDLNHAVRFVSSVANTRTRAKAA